MEIAQNKCKTTYNISCSNPNSFMPDQIPLNVAVEFIITEPVFKDHTVM